MDKKSRMPAGLFVAADANAVLTVVLTVLTRDPITICMEHERLAWCAALAALFALAGFVCAWVALYRSDSSHTAVCAALIVAANLILAAMLALWVLMACPYYYIGRLLMPGT